METNLSYFSVILGAFVKLRKGTVNFVMSVGPSAWNTSASSGQILMKFDILVFLKKSERTFKLRSNMTQTTGTLLEDQYIYIFVITSHSVLLKMRNGSKQKKL
jgi:hypothetical protein